MPEDGSCWSPKEVGLEAPPKQHGPNGEARADRREQHEIALLQASRTNRVVQRERDRRRRRVAESIDVDKRFVGRDAEFLRRRLDDAPVGLM